MKRTDAEGADGQPLDALAFECGLELRGSARSPMRRASRTWTGCSPIRLNANASTLADDGSSHWTSSTASTTGAPQREPPVRFGPRRRACADRQSCAASSSNSATSSARLLGGDSSGQDSRERLVEQVAEPDVSEPSLELCRSRQRTHIPRSRAASTPADQMRRLSDPRRSPSSTNAVGPSRNRSRNARTESSSASLPIVAPDISAQDRDRVTLGLHDPERARVHRERSSRTACEVRIIVECRLTLDESSD